MLHRCIKCKEEFTSEYLLNKHKNRKVSCDVILKCTKCLKSFSSSQSLERHYNKSIPCISTIEFEKRIKKQEREQEKHLKKERLKQIDLENKMKLKEKDLENKIKLLNIKKESNMTYINMYAENNKEKKAIALEIIDAKASHKKEIESIKTERKWQTTQVINNNITINNTNICINYIKNILMENKSLSFKSVEKNSINLIDSRFQYAPNLHKKTLSIIKKYTTLNEIISYILSYTLNNKRLPDERCIYYINKKYFAIMISDTENQSYDFEDDSKFEDANIEDEINDVSKNVEEIDFMKDLLPVIKTVIKFFIEKLTDILMTAYNFKFDSDEYLLCEMLNRYIHEALHATSSINDLEKISNEVFLTIIPENYKESIS